MRRTALILAAAALAALVGVVPVLAQEEPAKPEIADGTWDSSYFNDDFRTGSGTRSTSSATVTGQFTHDFRSVTSITASVPSDGACAPTQEITVGPATPANNPRTFSVTVSSACNRIVRLTATGGAHCPLCPDPNHQATLTTDITIAVPPKPVPSATATVPDTASKDVTVSWTVPDGTAPDTTYVVQRVGPGDDAEWESVTEPMAPDPENASIVDTVEADGIYRYRVAANRPLVNSVYIEEAVAQVRVGEEPVDETPDTGSQSPVTQPGSATTITIPRLGSSRTPNRVSTHTTVTIVPRGPATTIDTGFEETLDYSDREDEGEPGELAAEGQSIISSDDDGVIGPGAVAASVLVLVGWAGHVVYIRRLAAQF